MTEPRVTINAEVNVEQDVMDAAKRLLQEKIEQHPNCRSSTVPRGDDELPPWDSQRVTSFWDAYFNRVTNDG